MKLTKKRIFLVLLSLMVIGTLAAGGRAQSAAGGVEPKTISVALSENAVTLDPHYTTSIPVDCVRDMIWEPLVGYEEKADGSIEYVPRLCTNYSSSADGKVWTFNLRRGVKFSNGDDFSSLDCAVTFQRLVDNSATLSVGAMYWSGIEKYETPDDYTFILYMKEPLATMEIGLARTAIFNGKAFRQYGEDYINRQMMYGTGPWKFEQWVDGQYVRFSKNDNYWGSFRSYYDEVYIRFVTEESTGIASLLAGDIRVYGRNGGITQSSLALFQGRNDIELKEIMTTSFQYFGLQCRQGSIFNDIRARQAFSLAIDRQLIADTILPGAVPKSAAWFVTGIFGADETMPVLEYNPERARQLLRETGYAGQRIMLSSNTGTTLSSEILLAVSQMLNEVGFNTATEIVESAALLNMRLEGRYDVFLVNAMPGMNDVGEVLTQRVLQDYHNSNYINERVNALIAQSNQEFNRDRRRQQLTEANRLLTADWAPQILLNQIKQTNPFYKGVTGFNMTSFGQFYYTWITYDPALAR